MVKMHIDYLSIFLITIKMLSILKKILISVVNERQHLAEKIAPGKYLEKLI